jgi:transposase
MRPGSAPPCRGVKIAVDKWHLIALANSMVTEVRQRVTRTLLGRRGTTADPIWLNRRMLLTGAEHLSTKQWNRLWRSFAGCDPTKEVQASWAVKERLRLLLGEREPSRIRWRLADFYEAAIDAHLPEATRLATTVQTWWPAILVALLKDVHNARTEGFIIWSRLTRGFDVADAPGGQCGRHVLWSLSLTSPMFHRSSGRPWRDSMLGRSGLRRGECA